MNKHGTILVDVDDVCADLSSTWLAKYNKDWNDNLVREDIKDWAIEKFVKQECGSKIFAYLNQDSLYDFVIPLMDARWGVKELRKMGHRVIFATACPIATAGRKFKWLQDYGFAPTRENYIELVDKYLLRADIIIDDSYKNVQLFQGYGILYDQPWNEGYSYPIRVSNWMQAIERVDSYANDYFR